MKRRSGGYWWASGEACPAPCDLFKIKNILLDPNYRFGYSLSSPLPIQADQSGTIDSRCGQPPSGLHRAQILLSPPFGGSLQVGTATGILPPPTFKGESAW